MKGVRGQDAQTHSHKRICNEQMIKAEKRFLISSQIFQACYGVSTHLE